MAEDAGKDNTSEKQTPEDPKNTENPNNTDPKNKNQTIPQSNEGKGAKGENQDSQRKQDTPEDSNDLATNDPKSTDPKEGEQLEMDVTVVNNTAHRNLYVMYMVKVPEQIENDDIIYAMSIYSHLLQKCAI